MKFRNTSGDMVTMSVIEWHGPRPMKLGPCAPGATIEIPDEYVKHVPTHAPQLKPFEAEPPPVGAVKKPS